MKRAVIAALTFGLATATAYAGPASRDVTLPRGTVLGGVVPIYNIPGITADLKFSGQVLADAFLGKITKWNDKAITALNPGVNLPATDITIVHR